jgi:hypothetical protein
MQDSQDKEASMEEVQTEYKKIQEKKTLVGERFSTPVQTEPGAYVDSCTMGTQSLSQG